LVRGSWPVNLSSNDVDLLGDVFDCGPDIFCCFLSFCNPDQEFGYGQDEPAEEVAYVIQGRGSRVSKGFPKG
jgi:hypothetical protein